MIENSETDDKVIYKVSPLARVLIEPIYYSYETPLNIHFANGKFMRKFSVKEPIFFFKERGKAISLLTTFSENKLKEAEARHKEAVSFYKEVNSFLEGFKNE